MYLKIDDDLKERIEKTTGNDYDFIGNFLPSEKVESIIEDLLCEIHRLEEEKKDREQEIEDNYRPISYAEQIGYNERDFY